MCVDCEGCVLFPIQLDWCTENIKYYPETVVSIANKTGVTWHKGDVFCNGLYRVVYLIDIQSEEEQLACLPLFGNNLYRVISE